MEFEIKRFYENDRLVGVLVYPEGMDPESLVNLGGYEKASEMLD